MQAVPDETDRALVMRCQAGDENALAGLVEKHQHEVYCFLLRQTGTEADALDLLQETMMGMAKSVFSFRADSEFTTWLKRIAQRKFWDWLRQKYSEGQHVSLDEEFADTMKDPAVPPDEETIAREETTMIHRAISELAKKCQEVVTLVDLGAMTYDEAGMLLNLSPKTVSTRLVRCRRKLKAKLERLFGKTASDTFAGTV
jgi:RNA polymerase sigma factor (sigma-70 family)